METAMMLPVGDDGRELRVLDKTHLAPLTALENSAQSHPWTEDQLLLEIVNDDAVVLGVFVERALIGYIATRRLVDELWIMNFAVEPTHRRRGHAAALFTRALAWGKAQGLASAWLEVREGNEAAHALYTAFGFTERGRRARYYADGENAVVMSTAL